MLLNAADGVYVGGLLADRVYLGSNLVWPAELPGGEITPPVYRSHTLTTYASRPSGLTLDKPAGVVEKDILLAVIVHARSEPAPIDLVAPAGWEKVGVSTVVNDTSHFYAKLEIFWKRAGPSEPATYFFDVWAASSNQSAIVAYSNCTETGSPVDVFSQAFSNNTEYAVAPSVSPSSANSLLFWAGHNWTASNTLIPPTGMTERLEYLLYVADEVQAVAGPSGTRSQMQAVAAQPWAVYMLALKGKVSAVGPWTPHEIEDAMWGWWDASIPSSLTWSGVNLLEIAGQAPGGIHMGRAASSGPTATTLNGLGALAFTYDQGLTTPVATTFNDFTIHAVFNPGFSDGSTYERIVDHSYAAGWWFGRTGGTQTFGGGIMEGPEVGYGIFVPLANNEVHQISNVREGSDHRISGNGGAVTNSRAIHTNPTASNPVFMAQDNLNLSDVTDGEIGEVIIWKRALSADEMAKTEGYLAWKWGIQAKLPAGHPYKSAAPGTTPPEITAPTDWLTVSFSPSAARDDFTGEVGMRILINETRTFTWIGCLQAGGNSGPRRVRVYEWFGDVVIAEAMIDMTGVATGEYAWVEVAPFTLTAAGYYAILAQTIQGSGQNWANTGAITLKPFIGNIYSTYRSPGGGMTATGPGESYVGVDIGWNT